MDHTEVVPPVRAQVKPLTLKLSLSHIKAFVMHTDSRLQRPRMPLTQMPLGAAGRVHALNGEVEVCQRLREMGFCESAVVQKISGQTTLLCQVCGTRVALAEGIAEQITVEVIRGAAKPPRP
jgi:ferrous iron transport protein A